MKPHDRLDDDARGWAALHAIGALSPEDAAAFERHLAICTPCRLERESLARTAESMLDAVPSTPVPVSLRGRLLERVRATRGPAAQPWQSWRPQAGAEDFVLLRGAAEGWEPTSVDGVEVRKLFVDEAADRVTMLVRMAPGTAYPSHRHAGAEECYVLEGDLNVGDDVLHAGDYQRADVGSRHGIQSTKNGCLLFIVSSMHDELTEGSRS